MGPYSTFLFARPSFIEGMARVVDIGGTLNVYNTSTTPELADFFAMYADWLATGGDIVSAIAQFARQYPEAAARVEGKEATREVQSTRLACGGH
jgi:hypothetical protein